MTTEDLIELLKQHPRESVGVAVHLEDTTAFCAIEKITGFGSCSPRVRIHVEAFARLDESSLYDAVRHAVILRGDHGGSHE